MAEKLNIVIDHSKREQELQRELDLEKQKRIALEVENSKLAQDAEFNKAAYDERRKALEDANRQYEQKLKDEATKADAEKFRGGGKVPLDSEKRQSKEGIYPSIEQGIKDIHTKAQSRLVNPSLSEKERVESYKAEDLQRQLFENGMNELKRKIRAGESTGRFEITACIRCGNGVDLAKGSKCKFCGYDVEKGLKGDN